MHVLVELAAADQGTAEAGNRLVGDGVQVVELDAEVFLQVLFIVCFQRLLRRRQAGALRVVDQIQLQIAAWLAVAQRVQLPEPGDAALEYAVAALAVDVVARIAGQGGGNRDV